MTIPAALSACTALVLAAVLAAGEPLPDWKKPYWPQGDAWTRTAQEFTFANDAEPETLDPQLATGVLESRLLLALYEGLVTLDPRTLEPRPGVAQRWDLSADRLTYTFHLRAGACWWDGSALTSADFIESWKRALDPKTGMAYADLLDPIAGARAFHKKETTDFASVGVSAPDAATVVIRLVQPCPYFLELCAFPAYTPVPMARVRAHGDRWVLPANILGNGPFRLSEWKPRERIVLERSAHYWDRDFVKLKTITVLPIPDSEAAYKLWQQGQLHWQPSLPLAKLDSVRRDGDYYATPYFGCYFYRFNVTKPPFDDVMVRRAFALALDRRRITDHVLKGGEQPTGSLCPPIAGWDPGTGTLYDRDAARRLLAGSAYGPGKKPMPGIELVFNTSDRHKQIAEAIVQQWQDVLGVPVALANREWKVYLADMDSLNYQVMRASWVGDYGDPTTFYRLFCTGDGNNRTGWSNAAYDAAFRACEIATDPAVRAQSFRIMEDLLAAEAPIAPIYRYVAQGLLREAVRGWERNVRDHHPWQFVWLE